jgi:predicted O-methyltransferase YrrM
MNPVKRVHNRLIRHKIRHYQDIEGWLSVNEAVTLHRLASSLPPQSTVVEVGSWKGKSTYCLAKGLRDGRVIAIDPFDSSGEDGSRENYEQQKGEEPLLDQFRNQMKRLEVLDKIHILQGFSSQFVGCLKEIDLLFIDGDHSQQACLFDFQNYSPALRRGGYLAFHDFFPSRVEFGPTWVVQNQVIPSKQYHFVGLFDSLWVARKM